MSTFQEPDLPISYSHTNQSYKTIQAQELFFFYSGSFFLHRNSLKWKKPLSVFETEF